MRGLQIIFAERGLLGFIVPYTAIVILLLVAEIGISMEWPYFIPLWSDSPHIAPLLKDVTSYFLAAQVVMVGLLFPIAVGMVTLIVQRESASSTFSEIRVYYSGTFVYQVGASGIALSIVLAAQILWPAHFLAHRVGFGTPSEFSKIVLTGIHLLWLVINFSALWHFLFTSLSFIRPLERSKLRRRFAADVAIPRDLMERLMRGYFLNLGSILKPKLTKTSAAGPAPILYFGYGVTDRSEIEVAEPDLTHRIVHDVWTKPLSWALRSWIKRCGASDVNGAQSQLQPILEFPLHMGYPMPQAGVICQRKGGTPLNAFERYLVRHSFKFRRATL